jgi:hypothetical protein
MEWVSRVHHCVTLWWGRGLDHVRLNRIRTVDVDGVAYVAKRRRWYAPLLIAVGNAYLRQIGAKTRILTNHTWHIWETEIYRLQEKGTCPPANGWLLIPLRGDTVLRDYLASHEKSTLDKLQAIRLASQSLARLHQLRLRWPDGRERLFSHGDATVRNVVLSEPPLTANWIDFDMGHQAALPDEWRHADDLRALLFSAASWFPRDRYQHLSEHGLTGYGIPSVIDKLAEIVMASGKHPSSFQLAQSGLNYDQNRQFNAVLLAAIAGC